MLLMYSAYNYVLKFVRISYVYGLEEYQILQYDDW